MSDTADILDDFFAGLTAGNVSRSLFSEDAVATTATSGTMPIDRYLGAATLLATVFEDGLGYERVTVLRAGAHIAVEARSTGRFRDGRPYANDYLFLFELDGGRICRVIEYFDVRPVQEALAPEIQRIMAASSKPA